jgi:hypothetical protein
VLGVPALPFVPLAPAPGLPVLVPALPLLTPPLPLAPAAVAPLFALPPESPLSELQPTIAEQASANSEPTPATCNRAK